MDNTSETTLFEIGDEYKQELPLFIDADGQETTAEKLAELGLDAVPPGIVITNVGEADNNGPGESYVVEFGTE